MSKPYEPSEQGAALRVGRGDLQLTIREAAALCNVSYSTWFNWETGRRRCPTYAMTFIHYLQLLKKTKRIKGAG